MLSEFEKKLADFIKEHKLFGSVEKILLAVSGGADSTALIYAMHDLKAENFFDAELLCAHINHQLRGVEGDLDEEFVVTRAKKLKLDMTTRRIDVRKFARLNKLSVETAARQLRIEALIDIAKGNDCRLIVTAHQKNDNAETIVQRLSRGTGLRGLGGIWPKRVFTDEIEFIRPLLCCTRDEILNYLQQRNLNWRRDHTNADCAYRRNYIRHQLIPALQQNCSGSVVEQLSQLAQSARGYYSMVCRRADELWPRLADCDEGKTVLDLEPFLSEPPPVKVELIRRSLTNMACGEKCLTQGHYKSIQRLAEQNVTGKKIELPGGFLVIREYGNLVFSICRIGNSYFKHELAHAESTTVAIPGQTRFDNFLIHAVIIEKSDFDFEKSKSTKTDSIEWFDFDRIKLPIIVRCRRPGDRFVPLGQIEEKKLGKFLTAQRVPHEIRRDVLVVADSEKIIWVWPIRVSEQSKITSQTRKILQLQITNPNA
jgi:tRNA(Ile)-lysidine synthase